MAEPEIVVFKDGTYGVRRNTWPSLGDRGYQFLYVTGSSSHWWSTCYQECRGTLEQARKAFRENDQVGIPIKDLLNAQDSQESTSFIELTTQYEGRSSSCGARILSAWRKGRERLSRWIAPS